MRAFLFSTLAAMFLAPACFGGVVWQYEAKLTELNNSGVTGIAKFALNGDTLNFTVQAQGLEPGKFHEEHIHGFLNKKPSSLPQLSQVDTNHNGMVDDLEAETKTGQELVYLVAHPSKNSEGNIYSDFPVADSHGRVNFTQTYTLDNPELVAPLSIRSFEMHGMTVMGAYNPQLPVAGGLLAPISSSSGGTGAGSGNGNGGGSQAVPLPPAVWSGLILLMAIGSMHFVRQRGRIA